MQFDQEAYRKTVRSRSSRSPILKNCCAAFLVGGAICTLGQILFAGFASAGADGKTAGLSVTVTLITLSALLTGIGVFDKIASFAGAGTLVPVTGFANAVVSPALDTKSEGMILGVGAKIFTVAGPVLLYAVLSGALYGLILWLSSLL